MIESHAKRMRWVASFGAAMVVHIAIGVILAVSVPPREREVEVAAETAAHADHETAEAVEPAEDVSPAVEKQEVRGQIAASMDRFAERDRQELAERGEQVAQWLETRSSEQSIEEIGVVVRNAYAVRTRAYAPVDPPPPGDFDLDTMLPYAVRQTTLDDGSVRVTYTWVDEEGRAKEFEMPEEASDPALTAALKMAQRSPMMRQLFQSSVLPVLESQLRPRP